MPRALWLAALSVVLVRAGDFEAPQTLPNRTLMVHLFEWTWPDVAQECETFLAPHGFGAVQISPPNDHITFALNNDMPWYVRYQPVSYKLHSRSGSEAQLRAMVERCNKAGVRIVADVVLNHMTGVGQKAGENGRNSSAASFFDASQGHENFPEVPFNSSHFNDPKCDHDIADNDYQHSSDHVRDCRLSGLLDLNHALPYVRNKTLDYLNKLISLGVAGFRFDASKHMWPDNLRSILSGMNNLREDIFGGNQRPFVVHEVIDRGGEAVKIADYSGLGRYTNFNFGSAVSAAARGHANFRSFVGESKLSNVWTGDNLLAFAREGKGFVALNNNAGEFIEKHVSTSLPDGVYCDLATGDKIAGKCSGKNVVVEAGGHADIYVPGNSFLAISLQTRL